MKNIFIKKILVSLIIITLLVPASFPQTAFALIPVEEVGANLANTIMIVTNTSYQAALAQADNLKKFSLDTIATSLAKAVIRQLTASVVNWINSGFKGNPAFVTNPSSFFLDVADQYTGEFLAGGVCQDVKQPDGSTTKVCSGGGPLTQLCSPFSIDLRIALAFKYHPYIPQRYTCTLGSIIQNTKNAVAGASINGFTAGDFKQGGWPAFVSLTTEPQNNAMGAYLLADDELTLRVANAQAQQRDELNQGKGFLSWRDCSSQTTPVDQGTINPYSPTAINAGSDYVTPQSTASAPVDYDPTGTTLPSVTTKPSDTYIKPGSVDYDPTAMAANGGKPVVVQGDCPIKTPGDVIVSSLEANVNGPLHELQLVNSINEIVNALFAQLITQVLSKGLGAVSGNGPSDGSSYLHQIQNDTVGESSQVSSIRTNLLKNLDDQISTASQYRSNKNQSLNLVLDAKNSYESVKQCYSNKLTDLVSPLTPAQASQAQSKISDINTIENTNITPLATQLLTKATDADAKLKVLTDLEDQINAAQTINDLNQPSQQYSTMLQNQTLLTVKDVGDSQSELSSVGDTVSPMKQDAQRKLQECQVFGGSGGSLFNTP